jgi:Flp pilus assembly protein TadD
MAQVQGQRPRRGIALALLATTAIATVLGGCVQSGPLSRFSGEPKLAAADAIGAVTQWSAAYAKNPQDPKTALGYANALKAIGSRDRALDVLTTAYRANQDNGEIAAELGRLALDMNRLEIAQQTLKVAEAQGVKDWKTLSAQGTLRAKRGAHAEAQQYFLAALQEQPDAVSVINNLALSYALDGKADKSEELLRKAVAGGKGDKRVRQNLAMVLGLQGKFEEARQIASVDMTEQEAKSSMAYMRNMLANPTQFAAAKPGDTNDGGDDWQPYAANDAPAATTKSAAVAAPAPAATTKSAATAAAAPASKMQVVKATEEVQAPGAAAQAKTAQAATPAAQAKPKAAGTPKLVTPVNATGAQAKAATAGAAPAAPIDLLRTETD